VARTPHELINGGQNGHRPLTMSDSGTVDHPGGVIAGRRSGDQVDFVSSQRPEPHLIHTAAAPAKQSGDTCVARATPTAPDPIAGATRLRYSAPRSLLGAPVGGSPPVAGDAS